MTIRSKILHLTVGAAAVLLGVGAFAATPAQAVSAPNHASGAQVLVAPAAPPAARLTAGLAAAVAAPTVSPSVSTTHVAPGTAYTCYSGDLCPVVWDYSTSSYKIFFLYICTKYSLSNWLNTGNYSDRQSSGAHTYFYGSSGNVLTSFYPPQTNVAYNWTPVYSIRNC
jgi:hypothetical protein